MNPLRLVEHKIRQTRDKIEQLNDDLAYWTQLREKLASYDKINLSTLNETQANELVGILSSLVQLSRREAKSRLPRPTPAKYNSK